MQLTFLGTGAGAPAVARNAPSLALRLPEGDETWLFDCGEGSQHQLLRTDLKINQITRIFITHLHGDHLFGLLGLLASRDLTGDPRRLDLYGPPGLADFVRVGLRLSQTRLGYPLEVHTVEAGRLVESGRLAARCLPLRHRVATFGYRVDEQDRPPAFDAARAAAFGLPAGPLYGRLKRGERIELPDGRLIDGAELLRPAEPGRSIAYCTDTAYCQNAVELGREVDLLIHEATFADCDAELALKGLHSTTAQAARVAREARARRLVLTHLSPRYDGHESISPDELLAEARAVFPNTDLAHDLLRIEVPRRRPRSSRTVEPSS